MGGGARGRGGRALTRLVLRSLKQAYYDDRNRGHAGPASALLLPLHLADPALSGPDLPSRAAVGGDGRRAGSGEPHGSRPPGRGLGAGA